MIDRRFFRLLPFAVVLTLALSACTVYVRPGSPGPTHVTVPLDNIITSFAPTRGAGAVYYVGETIQFWIRTNRSGYITLSAMDPDGRVYVLARNIFVPAYQTTILPTREMRVSFSAAPPTGLHRVRASFTPSRTNPGQAQYQGRNGLQSWSIAIDHDIGSYPVRDVADTTLTIR